MPPDPDEKSSDSDNELNPVDKAYDSLTILSEFLRKDEERLSRLPEDAS